MPTDQKMYFCAECNRQTVHLCPRASTAVHLILSLVTAGMWLPIWFLCSALRGKPACTMCGSKTNEPNMAGALLILGTAGVLVAAVVGAFVVAVSASGSGSAAPAVVQAGAVDVVYSQVEFVKTLDDGATLASWNFEVKNATQHSAGFDLVLTGTDKRGSVVYDRVYDPSPFLSSGQSITGKDKLWFKAGDFEEIEMFRVSIQ